MTLRSTHRWYGVAAIAFLAAAAGLLAGRPALLLASALGVGFAAYAQSASPPGVSLSIERELDDPEPDPGEEVTVNVRVRNTGSTLVDLRVVDGVPDPLEVADGSPRLGTALRRGKTAEYSYVVTAERGVHGFEPVTVIARDPSGAVERETLVDVATTLRCLPRLEAPPVGPPLREQTSRYAGTVPARTGGSGIEFHAIREYRPGDPMSRIDWNRMARTGEPTTVQLREERMVDVVLVVDAREESYVGGQDPALERSVRAAGRVFAGLLDDGHRTGIAAIGAGDCWLAPGTGEDHRARARRLLAADPALSPTPPERPIVSTRRLKRLRRRLSASAQVIFLTPVLDDYAEIIAGRLEAYGHAVTVLSPDVTNPGTTGGRLEGIERRTRIATLRGRGIPVIEWGSDRDFEQALATAARGRQ